MRTNGKNKLLTFCFVGLFLLLIIVQPVRAITVDELADICEAMETAIHDVHVEYEWYLDLKGLTSSTVLSKTGIEFLQTSSPESPAKVLTDSGEVLTSFNTTSNEEYFQLVESLVK